MLRLLTVLGLLLSFYLSASAAPPNSPRGTVRFRGTFKLDRHVGVEFKDGRFHLWRRAIRQKSVALARKATTEFKVHKQKVVVEADAESGVATLSIPAYGLTYRLANGASGWQFHSTQAIEPRGLLSWFGVPAEPRAILFNRVLTLKQRFQLFTRWRGDRKSAFAPSPVISHSFGDNSARVHSNPVSADGARRRIVLERLVALGKTARLKLKTAGSWRAPRMWLSASLKNVRARAE